MPSPFLRSVSGLKPIRRTKRPGRWNFSSIPVRTEERICHFSRPAQSDGEGIAIPVRLMQPETVLTEVTDISGNICYREEKPLETGTHLIQVPASVFPQAGVYVWRVRAGVATSSGKIVRL